MSSQNDFTFPFFYSYPPYFTLQPVKDTRDKQIALWKELILRYCRHHKVFVLDIADDSELFANSTIKRRLDTDARISILEDVVSSGSGLWLREKQRCLILWHNIPKWAEILCDWVKNNALYDEPMTLEEIVNGIESQGTEIHGVHMEILLRAVQHLEKLGRARLFQGTLDGAEGVKFFP
ncbi:Vacuolar protein-sorting-associated protein 25 [Cymbomonas tetramitiformis]|uniref:ESCRT-II complex subunit VPS25 n=1 Tax=Cymbomonas tetramitiformis TaxID=36881 RepID=A0AAE0KQT8_9CHLO|nr:Vacuolar protein-sorting-associated protein 25 [Cymbomonas tetramitiformis]